jgi:hypothetical protein
VKATRIVLPHTRAQAEHAAEVTARLHAEGPLIVEGTNLGLDLTEAICPACSLAFFVTDRVHSWGLCPDCLREALVRVVE